MTDTPTKGHNSHGIASELIRQTVERVERLEAEIADLNSDKRGVYAEAKANGLNVKALKMVVAERRKSPEDRAEVENDFALYWQEVQYVETP